MDDRAVAEAMAEAKAVTESLTRIAAEVSAADVPLRDGEAADLLACGQLIAERLIMDRRLAARQAAVDLISAIGHLNGLNLGMRMRDAARQKTAAAERG